MKFAITGGTGFIGGTLARQLAAEGHTVVVIARAKTEPVGRPAAVHFPIGLDDEDKLATAFAGCDAVAHCAGINREIGRRTYAAVHVAGTRNVVNAARKAGVRKVVFLSFLRARPNCGSAYHESKWAAEEIVRGCGLDFTILKPGVIYGRGDHMLDHLSRAFHTFPIFALVGMRDQSIRPTAVEDLAEILGATLVKGRLPRATVAVVGPEEMPLSVAVKRVAGVVNRNPLMFPMPLAFHYAFGWFCERLMRVPLVALAQVRILSEGIVEPLPPCPFVPEDLAPRRKFTDDQIRRGLPEPAAFGMSDLRCCANVK
jgi:NADH dehydrogenase